MKSLSLPDNALGHKFKVAQAAMLECKFKQLNHPPYSPALASNDCHVFQNLKPHLAGPRFRNYDELIAATEAWCGDQTYDFWLKGI